MQKSKKGVTVNFLYQSVYQLLLVIMPLITAPYISRVLGAANTGIYSYTYAIAVYFMIFSSLGIDTYGNRCIAKIGIENQNGLNKTFSGILFAHLIASVISIAGYYIYIVFVISQYKKIMILQGLWILSAAFDINWFFFGLEKFKITVTRNLIIKIMSVCLIFLLVHKPDDLWLYVLIMAGSAFFSQIVLWYFVFKYVQICRVSFCNIIQHLKGLLSLFIAVIASSIYIMIDKVMIGRTNNMAILGSYEYADKMIRIIVSLVTALGTVMMPRMTSLYTKHDSDKANYYLRISAEFIFITTCALGFGLAGIAKEFVPVFLGGGYEPATWIIIILCMAVPIMGWNNLVRTQILMPNMKDRIYTIAVWAGAIIDVLLNAVLIPLLSAYGAAVATVIAYLTVGLFQTIPIVKEFPIYNCLKYFIPSLIFGMIMFLAVRMIGMLSTPSLLSLLLQILVGALIYSFLHIFYMIISGDEILKYIRKIMDAKL